MRSWMRGVVNREENPSALSVLDLFFKGISSFTLISPSTFQISRFVLTADLNCCRCYKKIKKTPNKFHGYWTIFAPAPTTTDISNLPKKKEKPHYSFPKKDPSFTLDFLLTNQSN